MGLFDWGGSGVDVSGGLRLFWPCGFCWWVQRLHGIVERLHLGRVRKERWPRWNYGFFADALLGGFFGTRCREQRLHGALCCVVLCCFASARSA